jgi:hypothetical protein
MNTRLRTAAPAAAACASCSTISPALRLPLSPIVPVAQKVQPMLQPTWEEMQSVPRRPPLVLLLLMRSPPPPPPPLVLHSLPPVLRSPPPPSPQVLRSPPPVPPRLSPPLAAAARGCVVSYVITTASTNSPSCRRMSSLSVPSAERAADWTLEVLRTKPARSAAAAARGNSKIASAASAGSSFGCLSSLM